MTRAEADALARVEIRGLPHQIARLGYGADIGEEAVARALSTFASWYPRLDRDRAGSWLYVVARNEASKLARQHREIPTDAVPAASSDDVDARVDVRRGLERLKTDERLALSDLALGFRYAEIASRRGWTRTKVNRCVYEGRRALRELVAA